MAVRTATEYEGKRRTSQRWESRPKTHERTKKQTYKPKTSTKTGRDTTDMQSPERGRQWIEGIQVRLTVGKASA